MTRRPEVRSLWGDETLETAALLALLDAWPLLDPTDRGLTAREVARRIYADDDPKFARVRSVLEALGPRADEKTEAGRVRHALLGLRDRWRANRKLAFVRRDRDFVWHVVRREAGAA